MTLSICIPMVEDHINKKNLYDTFKKHNWGEINRIDLVKVKNKQRAFIHYHYWYNNNKSNFVYNLLNNDKDVKIIYDYPWYWKCVKNYSIK